MCRPNTLYVNAESRNETLKYFSILSRDQPEIVLWKAKWVFGFDPARDTVHFDYRDLHLYNLSRWLTHMGLILRKYRLQLYVI